MTEYNLLRAFYWENFQTLIFKPFSSENEERKEAETWKFAKRRIIRLKTPGGLRATLSSGIITGDSSLS